MLVDNGYVIGRRDGSNDANQESENSGFQHAQSIASHDEDPEFS